MITFKSAVLAVVFALAGAIAASPCTRVVFVGDSTSNRVMVGRTLDWRTPIPTNLYVYPRGIERQSMPSEPMLRWTSKYGSVLAVGYDGGVTEGMNEQGLVMNGLFCKGTVYAELEGPGDKTPVMSLAVIVSFFLDNFASVEEAYEWLQANRFVISGKTFDGGTVSTLHWGLTDRTGETMIMEYVGGKLDIYRSHDYLVLTNDPTYNNMLAIDNYWKQVGGVNMLPGTVRSPDRFVRADFFIRHVPKNTDYNNSLAALSSVMGTVTVPYGYVIEGEPNVSSTQWRSISDATGGRYYFKFACSTADFYVDFNKVSLNSGAPILKLDTTNYSDLSGCINELMKTSEGFTPMW